MTPSAHFTNRKAKGLGVYAAEVQGSLSTHETLAVQKEKKAEQWKRKENLVALAADPALCFSSSLTADWRQLRGGASRRGAWASGVM